MHDELIDSVAPEQYAATLTDYLTTRGERALYRASVMAAAFVAGRVGPDDILALHVEALEQATAELEPRAQVRAATDALQFLLEIMVAYGTRHKEHMEHRLQELAESRASREEVLAAVAHELRTPLTAVKGNLDLAERRLHQGEVAAVPPLLGQSRSAVERLVRMTGDLLDAERTAGAPEQRARVELGPVLAHAVALNALAAAEKGVGLSLDPVPPGVCAVGQVDDLTSVFTNLASNAVRYTPPSGTVAIRAVTAGEEVAVEVRDTGIGMSPDVQARAFEKYFRGPEARGAAPQGLGIGLALVKRIVEEHGGRVELESERGRGSTFRVCLPCWRAERGSAG
jgi:signal transduction histidine kinase